MATSENKTQELATSLETQIKTKIIGISAYKIQAWIVCLAASLFFFYDFVQTTIFNSISPGIIVSFKLNATELGNLSAIYLYATLAVLLPIGLLLDRYSTKKLILAAMLISVISTALFAISTSIFMAYFFRLTAGLSGSFCFLSTIILATRWFPPQKLAFITGIIVTIAMAGGIMAQTPMTLLMPHFGWRTTLLYTAAGGALIWLLIYLCVQDYPSHDLYPEKLRATKEKPNFWVSIKLSICNKQNWFCGIYTCLLNLPILVLGALWGNSFLVKVHNLTHTAASFIISMIFVGTIIGSTLFGLFSDYTKSRRWPMIIGAATSLLTVLIIIYLPNPSFYTLANLFLALGFFTSSQIISYPIIVESNPAFLTGAAEGLSAVIIMSGGAIFQPLFGWLMDLHHQSSVINNLLDYDVSDYKYAFIILPIAFTISLLLAFLIKETYKIEN